MINMHLGTWQFPSGNSCDVHIQRDASQMGQLLFETAPTRVGHPLTLVATKGDSE